MGVCLYKPVTNINWWYSWSPGYEAVYIIRGPGWYLIKHALNLALKIVVEVSFLLGGINSVTNYPHQAISPAPTLTLEPLLDRQEYRSEG